MSTDSARPARATAMIDARALHGEILDPGTRDVWQSLEPISREDYEGLPLPPGWLRIGVGAGAMDEHWFRRSPGEPGDGPMALREIGGRRFGLCARPASPPTQSAGPDGPRRLLVDKHHVIRFAAGREVPVLRDPDGECFVHVIEGGEGKPPLAPPAGWSLELVRLGADWVVALPTPTTVYFFPNGDSYQGPLGALPARSLEARVEPRFEPCGGERWRDPFPMYRALRDRDPVHRVPDNGEGEDYWVLSRFQHVLDAAVDAASFSSASGLTFLYGEMETLGIDPPIVMLDPPEHTALRKLVIKRFTPQQVRALEPMVRAFAAARIERLRERGRGDVVAELLKPLPSLVVAHFLGVAPEDRGRFDRWTEAIVTANAGGNALAATDAVGEMLGYFGALIERRRHEPADDLISSLVHGRLRSGEAPSLARILGVAFTMVTGGNDTTTGLLGGALELLTRHPEQRTGLADDPARMKRAIEEFLRLTSPVQGLARTTTRDVAIEGTTIPAGRKVMLLYASANRDEREFGPDAETCDVSRAIRRQLGFSYGPHHCIGAAAARLQATIALEELLRRCPEFSVDAAAGRYAPGPFVRRFEHLPFEARGLSA